MHIPPQSQEGGESIKQELLTRLKSIIRTVSRKENIEIIDTLSPQAKLQLRREGMDPDTTWFCSTQHDPHTKAVQREFIYIPPEMSRIPEDEAKGKAAHEAGHTAITRYGQFVPDEVTKIPGFSSLLAAVEERPTDHVVRETYPGAGEWVDAARLGSLHEGATVKQTQEMIGSTPRFMQLNNTIVYGRFPEQFESISPEVRALYQELQDVVEDIETTLPSLDANEVERVVKAKDRYAKTYLELWPRVKQLIAQDKEDESLREMLDEQMKQEGMQDASQENIQKALEEMLEQMTETQQQELLDAIKDALEQAQEGGQAGTEGKGEGEDVQNAEGSTDASSGEADGGDLSDEASSAESEGGKSLPLDVSKLSEGLQKALKKIFDSLPEKQKKKLEDQAGETLSKIEDDMTKSFQADLNKENNLPTHKEIEEQEGERKIDELRDKQHKEMEKVTREAADASERVGQPTTEYEKTFQLLRDDIDILYEKLEEVFHPNIKRKAIHAHTGSRLDVQKAFKRTAQIHGGASEVDHRVFERVYYPEKKDYAVTLLVDLSGSMRHDNKITETFRGVVLLTEVLARLGVKVEILGFQDQIIVFKSFDGDMNDSVRGKMDGMKAEVTNANPRGHNKADFNDDGPCLEDASERLTQQATKEQFLIVLSDGIPEGSHSGSRELQDAVNKIYVEGVQKLIGIGLGKGTEHVKKFYGNHAIANCSTKELPHIFADLLMNIMLRPEEYIESIKNLSKYTFH